MRITRVTIARTGFGSEWVCRAYGEDGKRYPAADCYENSKADAEATAKAMVRDSNTDTNVQVTQ